MSLDFSLTTKQSLAGSKPESMELFSRNITHNLGEMADKAGIYMCLWRPDELGLNVASEIVDVLTEGLSDLKNRPEFFKKFNPENGFGDYDGLVEFAESTLTACKKYPLATIDTYT
jgi:hypothetical protein